MRSVRGCIQPLGPVGEGTPGGGAGPRELKLLALFLVFAPFRIAYKVYVKQFKGIWISNLFSCRLIKLEPGSKTPKQILMEKKNAR